MQQNIVVVSGKGSAANGAADTTLIAAPGSGKTLYLLRGFLSVRVAAVGGGGLVALEDGAGGARLVEAAADSTLNSYFPFDFGDEGIPLTSNTLLNLTTDTAVTTQATVFAVAVCKVVG